jgi:hypothetical protein
MTELDINRQIYNQKILDLITKYLSKYPCIRFNQLMYIINETNDYFNEEQDYYLKVKNSRFEYIQDVLFSDEFEKETKRYIKACKVYYENKELQKPLREKQKEFEREKRKFLQKVKMSKEVPTKKQIYYYEKLCKSYNIEKKDVERLSKLDMKNEIEAILNEHS